MIAAFEDLSNELLINILEHLAVPADVYRAFSGLNVRFDSLLQFVRLPLDIFHEDKQSLAMIRSFEPFCTRLRIHNMCPSISLKQFPRLRSLTITEPTDAQIRSIQSATLPMLEYLTSPAYMVSTKLSETSNCLMQLISQVIFDGLFGDEAKPWQHLRSCHFYFPHFPTAKLTWQPNCILRTLYGVTCSRATLSQLLSLLPCLSHLRADMSRDDTSAWDRTIFRTTLVSLRIGFYQLDYDDLDPLLGSRLHRLHLEVLSEQPTSVSFARLATVLMASATQLKQFNCDYRGIEVAVDSIRACHSMFRSIQAVKPPSADTHSFMCRILT